MSERCPAQKGDIYQWMGCLVYVLGIDGDEAITHVEQIGSEVTWAKRQPLIDGKFPESALLVGHLDSQGEPVFDD